MAGGAYLRAIVHLHMQFAISLAHANALAEFYVMEDGAERAR
jgi:hypothetical protein